MAPALAPTLIPTAAHAQSTTQPAKSEAVIVMYHRFGENQFPTTNVRLEQFDAHITELKSGAYSVLPLAEVTAALLSGKELPPRTVVITIDDAYLSVYQDAWPRLKAAGLPFTLFVSTESVDQQQPDYMTWSQVRELAQAGVTIGHHAHSHASLITLTPDAALADIAKASERFKIELGSVPTLFAYPYGEFDIKLRDAVAQAGFLAAFGQHSGVASDAGPYFSLPRFALNENFSAINRFKLIVNARALPVKDVVPADPRIRTNPPAFGFTAVAGLRELKTLACYASHTNKAAALEILGTDRVEVRFDTPFPKGRSRVNCTMPGPGGRWFWLGQPFFVD